jgi:DNA polymerase II
MQAWLIDSYRNKNNIVLWLKTQDEDICKEIPYSVSIYVEIHPLSTAALKHIKHSIVEKTNQLGNKIKVYEVPVPAIENYERFVQNLEQLTRFRVPLYNADIPPEQHFLYKNSLIPCAAVRIDGNTIVPDQTDTHIPFSTIDVQMYPTYITNKDNQIKGMKVDDKVFSGTEKEVLEQFCKYFHAKNPDIIIAHRAFQALPHIAYRMQVQGIICNFHRWHGGPLKYRGGKSFYSYGQVRYQDFAVRLNGRFLVDKTTMVGSACDIEAIVELVQLSGARFQQIASRSFGAVFQAGLVRTIFQRGHMVPYKHKPVERPLSMLDMLNSDRAGHTFDPIIGFHANVAEIDFASMYPWLIYNHNISADTIMCNEGPYEQVPGTSIKISLKQKGLVPQTIKPLIDKRMHYKNNPTRLNKLRASGLKWVLVSSYGYLRFREFKMGLASSHMAICAFAREILMDSVKLCEEKNYNIIHGIVDALYIQRDDIQENEVRAICKEIEVMSGIPMSFEGIFKWVVFLPSINDSKRPVPTRYYGVFKSGEIKVRGIELRQRGTPFLIKKFQQKILESMAECNTQKEIVQRVPSFCKLLRQTIQELPFVRPDTLGCTVRVSKIDYKHNIPQKKAVEQLFRKGVPIAPGQSIQYVYSAKGIVLPEDYNGKPDIKEYSKRLVRSLFVILQPFGITLENIEARIQNDYQSTLVTYTTLPVSANSRCSGFS